MTTRLLNTTLVDKFMAMSDSEIDSDKELAPERQCPITELLKENSPTETRKRKSTEEAGKSPSGKKGKSEHEVSNADLFSLLTSYMNNKLSGIEKNLSDTTENLVKRVKKSENTFKFKGNQVQFELNSDIQDNIGAAIMYNEKNRLNLGGFNYSFEAQEQIDQKS